MNIRKQIDYSTMYAALNTLMASPLSQMELYCEIGKLVSAMLVKGAAVAAAEYLSKVYPDIKGFSPRNLRRMRDFYRAYKDAPEALAEAMTIGWTQNAVILENYKGFDEQIWYIRAVHRFSWTKAELLEKIHAGVYLEASLDLAGESYYVKEKTVVIKSTTDNQKSPEDRISNQICGNKQWPCLVQFSDRQGSDQHSKQEPYLRRSRWKPPSVGCRGSPGSQWPSLSSRKKRRFAPPLSQLFSGPYLKSCRSCSTFGSKVFSSLYSA